MCYDPMCDFRILGPDPTTPLKVSGTTDFVRVFAEKACPSRPFGDTNEGE